MKKYKETLEDALTVFLILLIFWLWGNIGVHTAPEDAAKLEEIYEQIEQPPGAELVAKENGESRIYDVRYPYSGEEMMAFFDDEFQRNGWKKVALEHQRKEGLVIDRARYMKNNHQIILSQRQDNIWKIKIGYVPFVTAWNEKTAAELFWEVVEIGKTVVILFILLYLLHSLFKFLKGLR